MADLLSAARSSGGSHFHCVPSAFPYARRVAWASVISVDRRVRGGLLLGGGWAGANWVLRAAVWCDRGRLLMATVTRTRSPTCAARLRPHSRTDLRILKTALRRTARPSAVVLLRVALYASLLPHRPLLLVAVTALSRAPCVWLMATLDYVTPENVARNSAIASTTLIQASVATVWSAAVLAVLGALDAIAWGQALAMAAVAAAVGLVAAWRYRARVGE